MSTKQRTAPAPPRKPKNDDVRGREHLTPAEVEQVAVAAAEIGRNCFRDALMIRVGFRHGFRVSELVGLRRDQLDLPNGLMHVRRAKGGLPSTHPMGAWEIRALNKLAKNGPESPYVFVSERGSPLTESAFFKMFARAGRAAGLPLSVHPHMLRHSCGYKLANEGRDTRAIQAYLGHKSIANTVRYTALSPTRFKDFWSD
jgi:integrase